MNKGQLMDLVYSPEERGNIDAGLPKCYWDGVDPSIQVNKFYHVMNFNENRVSGKLENMLEVAEQRGIELPHFITGGPLTPEKMQLISNVQMLTQKALDYKPDFYNILPMTVEELRKEQDRLVPLYNQRVKSNGN